MNFKNIHIGQMIEKRVIENDIEMFRICNFLKCEEDKVKKMYGEESLPTHILLKWSKLLGYDFFRIYSQHLVLYAPPKNIKSKDQEIHNKSVLPKFRKSIYTKEIIEFILEKIEKKEMTVTEIIQTYNIPKTTIYKWISKNH